MTAEPEKNEKPPIDHTWHQQQSKLLQQWAEMSSSYRWIFNKAYIKYKKRNTFFIIPLIIINNLSSTISFSTKKFPISIRPFVPHIVGSLSLIAGILTTIYNFLKISENMEAFRMCSISYGKLSRHISTELNLPVKDRSSGGADMVKFVRLEFDRLVEQAPVIPKHVLIDYESKFKDLGLSQPEILVIKPVEIYEDRDDNIAKTVANAGVKLKNILLTNKKNKLNFPIKFNLSENLSKIKESRNSELESLSQSKIVSKNNNLSFKEPEIVINMEPEIPRVSFAQSIDEISEPEQSPEPEINTESQIQNDISNLNQFKIVSSFKKI